jgi:HEAT repeat protein
LRSVGDTYSEPVYRGKTVSQWFERLDDGMPTYKDENQENEAMAALGALGQEAVPYLMKQFSTHNSKLPDFVARILSRDNDRKERHRNQAYVVLMRFGPKAERAVPELLRLAHDKQFPDREGAVKLLGAIRSQPRTVVPLIMDLLHDTNRLVQRDAIMALGKYGTNGALASPALKQLLTNEHSVTRMAAATALVGVGDLFEPTFAVISNALREPRIDVCQTQLRMLGDLGKNAKPAAFLMNELINRP